MGRISFQFQSKTLFQPTTLNIYIPDNILREGGVEEANVIYMLHGKGGNQDSWGWESSAFHYADLYGFILIMPFAANSFYTNMAYGDNYWDFIAKELPRVISNNFKISSSKEKTFVCGYSMGGYGALKLGLSYPERYKAIATLSGSLRSIDDTKAKINNEGRPDLLYAFGDCDEKVKQESDIYFLTEEALAKGIELPKLYVYCGKKDSLYDVNCRYRDFALRHGIDIVYREDEGNHTFYYWNKELKVFFETIANLL